MLKTELKTGLESVTEAGVEMRRWREGGENWANGFCKGLFQAAECGFCVCSSSGDGAWVANPVLVLCQDVTLNNL